MARIFQSVSLMDYPNKSDGKFKAGSLAAAKERITHIGVA
jgi:hypothetical protein